MSDRFHLNKVSSGGLLVALGIIYGDIGTSPLYVLKAVAGNAPIDESIVYGALSCIFWTLTLLTTIKYVLLVLRADNRGEGGIFALRSREKERAMAPYSGYLRGQRASCGWNNNASDIGIIRHRGF